MRKKRLIILLLVLCFPISLFAETIVLKSGKTVEGKIIEKTDKYIKIDFQGVPITYFLDEIESINETKQDLSSAEKIKISQGEKMADVSNKTAEEYFQSGEANLRQRNFTQAISDYTQCIRLEPTYPAAYLNRGNVYMMQNNTTQAIMDYDKAIELSPNFAGVYVSRGLAYAQQGNPTQAISDCTRASTIDPSLGNSYGCLAFAYYDLKEYDKAWVQVHKAETLGHRIHGGFLAALKTASGREE